MPDQMNYRRRRVIGGIHPLPSPFAYTCWLGQQPIETKKLVQQPIEIKTAGSAANSNKKAGS
jgi:hypothetical protein